MNRFSDLVSIAARSAEPLWPNFSGDAVDSSLIKLDSNENPFGPSPRAIEAMRAAAESAHAYPDDNCTELRRKLAELHGVGLDQVLVTPGSTGMLSLLCQTLLGPGLNAVTSERSFIVYGMVVKAAGGQLIEAPMHGEEFDLSAILRSINQNTRLVFLANPNNPTGTLIDQSALREFLVRVPQDVVVILDEAYYEFALHFADLRKMKYPNSPVYMRQGAGVVVTRTFSKVHGLAGLRIGYGLGPAELLGYCARMANTYSVPSISQTAALAALNDQEHIGRTLENNASQAQELSETLVELGFRVIPTWANFIYCDVGGDAAAFAEQLRAGGIRVRPMAAWGDPNCVRITIGTPQQNAALLERVRQIRGERSALDRR